MSLGLKKHRKDLIFNMPSELREKILAQTARSSSPLSALRKFNWSWLSGSALAASLVAVISFQAGHQFSAAHSDEFLVQEILSGHVRSTLVNHLSDVESTNRHTVKPWFEGKLDFAPNVMDFAEKNFPLVGGRLDYIGGRPVAALIYKFDQHIVNVFQWPSSEATEAAPKFLSRRGYQIFTWQAESMNYWVISDCNATDLQKFVSYWQKK